MTTPGFPPLVAGHNGRNRPRVQWDKPLAHRVQASPICGGGWMILAGTPRIVGVTGGGVNPQLLSFDAASAGVMRRQISVPQNETDTYSSAPTVTLSGLEVQYRRDTGDTIDLNLVQYHRSTGATTILDTWTSGGGTPDFPVTVGVGDDIDEVTLSVSEALDFSTYDYFFEFEIDANVNDADSVSVGFFDYELTTTGLMGS